VRQRERIGNRFRLGIAFAAARVLVETDGVGVGTLVLFVDIAIRLPLAVAPPVRLAFLIGELEIDDHVFAVRPRHRHIRTAQSLNGAGFGRIAAEKAQRLPPRVHERPPGAVAALPRAGGVLDPRLLEIDVETLAGRLLPAGNRILKALLLR
jgi:hypothetical protein